MSLPIIEQPIYETTLPVSGEKVKYRPFLVKEERILLMALESQVVDEMIGAVKQIISNCTFGKVNYDEIAPVDSEYLFLELRKRAKGEESEIAYRCKNTLDDGSVCNTINEISIDLNTATLTKEVPERIINITDTIGIEMKIPTGKLVSDIAKIQGNKKTLSAQDNFLLVAKTIDSVFVGEEVHKLEDYSPEEVTTFMESISSTQYEKIKNYLDEQPKIAIDFEFVCKKCGHTEKVHLEGISNFFD